jgi:hypothetical protein
MYVKKKIKSQPIMLCVYSLIVQISDAVMQCCCFSHEVTRLATSLVLDRAYTYEVTGLVTFLVLDISSSG